MFPLPFSRLLTTVLSLLILAGSAYLLWSWYVGDLIRDEAGVLYREREAWLLWAGVGLLAWSFLGRMVVTPLLARADTRTTRPERGDGRMIASPTEAAIYTETHGPLGAPTIILTHGWGMDSTFWHYAKQDLADRFHVMVWDLPGLGKSRLGSRRVSLPDYALDLTAVIERAGTGPVVLVGHSIGGMIIQTLIRDNPQIQERLAGVVLLNTTYANPLKTMLLSKLWLALQRPLLEPGMKLMAALYPLFWLSQWQSYLSGSAHMAQRLGFGKFVTRSQLEHATLLACRNSPRVQAHGNLAMFDWDASTAFQRLRVPALVIGGDHDIVTKLEGGRKIAGESNLAALRVVEGVNHMGPMERADLYNLMIAEFVLGVSPAAFGDVARASSARDSISARPSAPRPEAPGLH